MTNEYIWESAIILTALAWTMLAFFVNLDK